MNRKPSFHQSRVLVKTEAGLCGSVGRAVRNAAWCVSQRRCYKRRQPTDGAAGPLVCEGGGKTAEWKGSMFFFFFTSHNIICTVNCWLWSRVHTNCLSCSWVYRDATWRQRDLWLAACIFSYRLLMLVETVLCEENMKEAKERLSKLLLFIANSFLFSSESNERNES